MVEVDLFELLKQFLRKWLTILICTILCGGIGFGLSNVIPKQYKADSKVYIRGTSSISTTLADLQIGSYLSNDYTVIFKSRPVLEKTINKLQLNMTTKELSDILSVSTISDTRILSISCKTHNPDLSRDIVNTVVNAAIAKVNEIDAKEPYIVEKAISPVESVSLSSLKMVAIGLVVGFVLSCVYVALSYILNDKVSSAEDLEKLGLTVLGQVYEDESFTPKDLTKEATEKENPLVEASDMVKTTAVKTKKTEGGKKNA